MHSYIADALHDSLSDKEIKQINLKDIGAANVVKEALNEAYDVCARFMGGQLNEILDKKKKTMRTRTLNGMTLIFLH